MTHLRIEGECAPQFSALRAAFEGNFSQGGEIGAAVCVYQDGVPVVDLWGGVARPATGLPWERDTLVCMMSVGKSLAALCVLVLVERGRIDLDAPVARYWPRFAHAGKAEVTVRQLMAGQAGVLYADAAPDDCAFQWDVLIDALEVQAPSWLPGQDHAYHSMTYGVLLGELVRRVDGRPIDRFFAEEVAGPLGVDYHYGLTDAQIVRTADIIPNEASNTLTLMADPTSKLGRAWRILPSLQSRANAEDFRKGVFPSANGHGNARSVARIYALLAAGGELDGVRLLSQDLLREATTPVWDGICAMTDRPYRYALGFFVNCPPLTPMGPNDLAFGHPGVGGALAFADPQARLSFAYSPNAMCEGAGVGARCEALLSALDRDLQSAAQGRP